MEPGGRAATTEESLSKAVSANITSILEDLLKDYDKTERPSFNEGERVDTETDISSKW